MEALPIARRQNNDARFKSSCINCQILYIPPSLILGRLMDPVSWDLAQEPLHYLSEPSLQHATDFHTRQFEKSCSFTVSRGYTVDTEYYLPRID